MEIILGNIYIDRENNKVRVICVDKKSNYGKTIVGLVMGKDKTETVRTYFIDGTSSEDITNPKDLIREYSIWDDVAIDTKIYVRDDKNDNWDRVYFAEYKDSAVYSFVNGGTSWNRKYKTKWEYAKLAEE